MPTFKYNAMDSQTGAKKEGEVEAKDEAEVKQRIKNMGLVPLSITKKGGKASAAAGKKSSEKKGKNPFARFMGSGIKTKDIAVFCRQLAVMINSGVSLLRCINVLYAQSENESMKSMLQRIRDELSAGVPLSGCLAKFPRQFDKLFVSMVRAGEASGSLDVVLNRLSEFLESSEALKGKVKGAMVYPIIVLTVAGGIVFMLVTFVIPVFAKMFTEAGMKLPPPTQLLVDISRFMQAWWWLVIGGIVGTITGLKKFIQTEKGRRAFDTFMLKAPLFGTFTRKVAVGRFTRTMATLLDSGVPILQAFDIVADVVNNGIIADAIIGAKGSIKEGNTIAKPLADSGQFPLMVTQMIEIGEESGAISKMLEKVADFNDREVDEAVTALVSAMEPLTIVLLAGVIGGIVVALFMPMFQISNAVGD